MKAPGIVVIWILSAIATSAQISSKPREDSNKVKNEIVAVPLDNIKITIVKNMDDGKWYALIACKGWIYRGNSYSHLGTKNKVMQIVIGGVVGIKDVAGSIGSVALNIQDNLPTELYLESVDGIKLLVKKYDGKVWSDPK
jgi:hypothetical protein